MTTVEVIGAGALAQLLCRDLLAAKAQVMLYVPQGKLSDQQQHRLNAELRAQPWMKGVMEILGGHPDVRLFAGTPEQFWAYQSSHHNQTARSPMLLLTSWCESHSALRAQLDQSVYPCYPRVTVESWQGRLAVLGHLVIEIPNDIETCFQDWSKVRSVLDACGVAWELHPMEYRFKAHFARTCFAYWYLVNHLEATERGDEPVSRRDIKAEWETLQPILALEPDLELSLEMMELGLSLIRLGEPKTSDAAWILNVLLNHKRGKVEYFLQRRQRLYLC